jgi:methyl-accepting chemotaxis protein
MAKFPDFTATAEFVERLRDETEQAHNGQDLCAEAANLIERLTDRINHLTNVNDGLRETIAETRQGLAELRAMIGASA